MPVDVSVPVAGEGVYTLTLPTWPSDKAEQKRVLDQGVLDARRRGVQPETFSGQPAQPKPSVGSMGMHSVAGTLPVTRETMTKEQFSGSIGSPLSSAAPSENAWKPPESVNVGPDQFINLPRPPAFSSTSVPGWR